MVLNVKYIIITNGNTTFIACKGKEGTYSFIQKLPHYEDMLQL